MLSSHGASPAMHRREGAWLLLSLFGAALLAGLAQRYRVDVTRCAVWPPLSTNIACALLYTCALALLSLAWAGMCRLAAAPTGPSLHRVLGYALLVHLTIILGPPFLSDDVLFYAALSRGLAQFSGSAASPLCSMLRPDDRFLSILDAHWRCSVSSYLSGFHYLAWAVGKLGRDDLALHLRLYQAVAAAAMLLTGYLTGVALRGTAQRPAFGAALVVFNPLSLIEATLNAHNDALLSLGCALLILSIRRRRTLYALLCVGLSLTVKLSALLFGGLYGTHLLLRFVSQRSKTLGLALPFLLALSLCAGLALLARWPSAIPGLSGLIGSPAAPWEYCTRSIECLPRAILRWELHRPTWAWIVGLCFRGLGGLWLIYAAWRSQARLLPWLGTSLLVYYLYLHSWSQSWYFLTLLPLLPWTEGGTRVALRWVSVSACAYYALVLIGNCFRADLALALTDLLEGLVVVVPPSLCLWRNK